MDDRTIGERVANSRMVPIQRDGHHWTGFVNNDGVIWKILESDDATAEAWNRASMQVWLADLIDSAIDADRQEREAAAQKRIAELVDVLRAVEWVPDTEYADDFCPSCGKPRTKGHTPDCRLAAMLRGEAPDPQ